MFCLAEDHKIIFGIENASSEWRKTRFSTHFRLSGVVDRAITYCLLPHITYVWVVRGVISLLSNFFVKYPNLPYYCYSVRCNNYRLMHALFHIRTVMRPISARGLSPEGRYRSSPDMEKGIH